MIASAKNGYINYSRTVTAASRHDREICEETEGRRTLTFWNLRCLGWEKKVHTRFQETKVPKTFQEMFIAKGLILIAAEFDSLRWT